eukprot:sb/3470322/
MYQPKTDDDKKMYKQYQSWIRDVEQVAAPPLKHLTIQETELMHRAKKYAMECSVQAVLSKKPPEASGSMSEQQQTQQRDRAISLMCRVYVGSIHYDLNEDDLRKAFAPFGPIKDLSYADASYPQKSEISKPFMIFLAHVLKRSSGWMPFGHQPGQGKSNHILTVFPRMLYFITRRVLTCPGTTVILTRVEPTKGMPFWNTMLQRAPN